MPEFVIESLFPAALFIYSSHHIAPPLKPKPVSSFAIDTEGFLDFDLDSSGVDCLIY